jgi:predicted nucleotide-binding protein
MFIGHGHSQEWKDLRHFLLSRLNLECEEFNQASAAGLSTVTRLAQMLDSVSFAFLVMTAEDVHEDGTHHARENVIHEIGLFQGRLGFERAIVLKEEGCAEFSNIKGLTHISFPKGNIGAVFEEVRVVLERERIGYRRR